LMISMSTAEEVARKVNDRATRLAFGVINEVMVATDGRPEFVSILLGAVIRALQAAEAASHKPEA